MSLTVKIVSKYKFNTFWELHHNIRTSKNYELYKSLWLIIADQRKSYAYIRKKRQRKRQGHVNEYYGVYTDDEEDDEEDDDENDKKNMLETVFNDLSKIDNKEAFEKYILVDPGDYDPNDESIYIDIRFYWFFQTILTEQDERQIDLKSDTVFDLKSYWNWELFKSMYSSDSEDSSSEDDIFSLPKDLLNNFSSDEQPSDKNQQPSDEQSKLSSSVGLSDEEDLQHKLRF